MPWTATTHRVIFYTQPILDSIEPLEVDVGRIASVYLTASDDSEFFDPVSVDKLSAEE